MNLRKDHYRTTSSPSSVRGANDAAARNSGNPNGRGSRGPTSKGSGGGRQSNECARLTGADPSGLGERVSLAYRCVSASVVRVPGRRSAVAGGATGEHGRVAIVGVRTPTSDAGVRARLKEPSRRLVARPPTRDGRPDVDSFVLLFPTRSVGRRPRSLGSPPPVETRTRLS